MLRVLDDEGDNCGSDYHAGLDGYFGWSVRGDVLTVYFRAAADDDGTDRGTIHAEWKLAPFDACQTSL
jgi:hypothetical protein